MRDSHFRQGQGGVNCRAQSTTLAEPARSPTHKGNSSVTSGGQRQNMLYTLKARQNQEDSLNKVIGMLRVFEFDVYALLDPEDTLSFVTPYIVV